MLRYLCGGLGECQGHGGFGEDRRSGRDGSRRAVPYSSDNLTLGVEEQLRGYGLELQTLSQTLSLTSGQ